MASDHQTEEHVGEWKLVLHADSDIEILLEAARVLADRAGPRDTGEGEWFSVTLSARDRAALLADFINELIYLGETQTVACTDFRAMQLGETDLTCEALGAPLLEWQSPAKAATYHGLRFEREGGRWVAAVLLDV